MVMSSLNEFLVVASPLKYPIAFLVMGMIFHVIKIFPSDVANFAFVLAIYVMRVLTVHILKKNKTLGPYLLYVAAFIGLLSCRHINDVTSKGCTTHRFGRIKHLNRRRSRIAERNNLGRHIKSSKQPTIRFFDEVYAPLKALPPSNTSGLIPTPEVKTTRFLDMQLHNFEREISNVTVRTDGNTSVPTRFPNCSGSFDSRDFLDDQRDNGALRYQNDNYTIDDNKMHYEKENERTSDYETGPDTRSATRHPQTNDKQFLQPIYREYKEYIEFVNSLPTPAVQSWHFDIFDFFQNKIAETPFIAIVYQIFHKVGLIEAFNIPIDKFINFLRYVYTNYHDNPSDSDVELSHFKRDKNCIGARLLPIEVLATYLSAVVHDMDHPGKTNTFLIKKRDKLAILYNDRSVLENHHASEAWRALMTNASLDFLCNLTSGEYERLRYLVVDLILATDLIKHNKILDAFQTRTIKHNQSPKVDWTNTEERLLVCKMIIKIADVATPCKPLHLYLKWARRVQDEFYLQGDEERSGKDGVISEFMNRNSPDEITLQLNFITNVTLPVIQHFNEVGLFSIGLISNKCNLLEFLNYNQGFLARLRRQGESILPKLPNDGNCENSEPGSKPQANNRESCGEDERNIPSATECF